MSEAITFPYLIKRSPRRRRSISIQIKNNQVEITAPKSCSDSYLLKILDQKRGWIERQYHQQQQHATAESPRAIAAGDTVQYLGNTYTLQITPHSTVKITDEPGILTVAIPEPRYLSTALQHWYIQQAQHLFRVKTELTALRIDKAVQSVKVRHYKAKWGSCTATGHIRYNWLVIQAPEAVIDYLVAHEVSHLVYFNHSKDFWNLVAELCPTYQESRHWLRHNTHLLKRFLDVAK